MAETVLLRVSACLPQNLGFSGSDTGPVALTFSSSGIGIFWSKYVVNSSVESDTSSGAVLLISLPMASPDESSTKQPQKIWEKE